MGLREKKAQRNRDRIVSEALALFGRDGYEQTTMESIAAAAEVSASTLYRYFPSKDLIIFPPFSTFTERFSEVFARHSTDHPIQEALAEAIFAVLVNEDENREKTLLVRSIVDQSPIPRARLWDYLAEQERQMGRLLAERLHTREDDLRVIATARLANMIVGISADVWRSGGGQAPSRKTAEELLRLFEAGGVILPRAAQPRGPADLGSGSIPDRKPDRL